MMKNNYNESSASVLIVDNDKDDQLFIQMGFQDIKADVNLELFDNGRELMTYLNNYHREDFVFPKFILLDLNMPILDGKETLRLIKSNSQLQRIPVIILSTSSHPADIEKCYELGANSYICKPVKYTDYIDIANNLIKYWIDTVSVSESNTHFKFMRAV